jgi:HlyD family secretion protein
VVCHNQGITFKTNGFDTKMVQSLVLNAVVRYWKWLAAGLVGIAAAVYWWAGAAPQVQTTPVVQAYPSQSISILNATGYVVAQRKAALSSKATGRLEWLGVAEGAVVKSGQLIARIESRDTSAQFAQAQAQVQVAQAELTEAQQNLDRSTQLKNQKFISGASYDSAVARFQRAKANLAVANANANVAQANLAQTEIRAPFDAVVLTKNANEGDNITPFSSAVDSKGAVVTIADMSTLEVEVDVSESNMSRLKIGQPAEIGLDALPGERFAGSVIRMVPTIDRSKATRLVKVKFAKIDPRVLPDMSAKVVFLDRELSSEERQPVVAVSAQAVTMVNNQPTVYVLEGNVVKAVSIDAPQVPTSDLVPTPNLSPGQRVVIRPVGLKNGQRVQVMNP